jgi:hypothetical protein
MEGQNDGEWMDRGGHNTHIMLLIWLLFPHKSILSFVFVFQIIIACEGKGNKIINSGGESMLKIPLNQPIT